MSSIKTLSYREDSSGRLELEVLRQEIMIQANGLNHPNNLIRIKNYTAIGSQFPRDNDLR